MVVSSCPKCYIICLMIHICMNRKKHLNIYRRIRAKRLDRNRREFPWFTSTILRLFRVQDYIYHISYTSICSKIYPTEVSQKSTHPFAPGLGKLNSLLKTRWKLIHFLINSPFSQWKLKPWKAKSTLNLWSKLNLEKRNLWKGTQPTQGSIIHQD